MKEKKSYFILHTVIYSSVISPGDSWTTNILNFPLFYLKKKRRRVPSTTEVLLNSIPFVVSYKLWKSSVTLFGTFTKSFYYYYYYYCSHRESFTYVYSNKKKKKNKKFTQITKFSLPKILVYFLNVSKCFLSSRTPIK